MKKTKTNTQIKIDTEIFLEFKKQSYLRGHDLPEALEHAVNLYNEESEKTLKELSE